MEIVMTSGDILVEENRPLRLSHAHGTKICCTAGTVWITSVGETADIFLCAGQSHKGQGNGLTLIEGIGAGRIRLESNKRRALWQRAWMAAKRLWRNTISRKGQAASAPDWSA